MSSIVRVLLPLLLLGCVGRPNLTEIDKARLIKAKRSEAMDVLTKFKAGRERDLDLLERYVKLQQETTEIAPSTCPRCWAAFGEALSMLGWYYYEIYGDVLEEAETAPPAQKAKLLAEARSYKAEWQKYFTISNQAYETHFRSRDVPSVHPYAYERVMRHCEIMENYERALYYLEKYIDSYPIFYGQLEEPNRQKLEKLRRLYKEELQRQKERGLGSREKEPPLRRPALRAPPPAPVEEEE